MAFPSPAQDFLERPISLDEKLIRHPAATYFVIADNTNYPAGILQGAILVIDASLKPCDGTLLVCAVDGEFKIRRYRTVPRPHLEDLSSGRKEALPDDTDSYSGSRAIFGVVTYIINNARLGEFDDCPVM